MQTLPVKIVIYMYIIIIDYACEIFFWVVVGGGGGGCWEWAGQLCCLWALLSAVL